MPFLAQRGRTFPDFGESKEFFRTGVGTSPEQQITTAPAAAPPAAAAPATAPGLPAAAPAVSQPAAPAAAPQAPPQAAPPEAPGIPQLGYQTTGTGTERLLAPVTTGVQAGEQALTSFADMFREQAGPGRTFQDIGAPGTLETAITQGGAALDPARELVGAQYTGPVGLDITGRAGLEKLAADLRIREAALGTGGGIAETLRQSTEGRLTPGEARYTARDVLTPEYVQQLGAATAGISPFGERIGTEAVGAAEFAQARAQQEADIAAQSREYLGGREAGIESDIQGQIEAALAQQAGVAEQAGKIAEAPDFQATMKALEEAQQMGAIPPDVDLSQLDTEAQQALVAATENREKIMAKYGSVAQYELGVPGVGKRGKPSPFVRDAQGNLRDYREVIPKELQKDWTARQAELEEEFNPLRQKWMESQERTLQQTVSPIYYGAGPGDPAFAGQFQGPQQAAYLQFDPGVRPSRGNISTEDQRAQFNNINDLLGNLDRIAKDENVWKAATIGVNVEKYLEEEAAELEGRKDTLDQTGREWLNQVKKLRKTYKKKKKKEEWGKILGAGLFGAGVKALEEKKKEPWAKVLGSTLAGAGALGVMGAR